MRVEDRDHVMCGNGTGLHAGSFYNIDLLGFRLALAWSDIDSPSSVAACKVELTPDPFTCSFGHFVYP